MQQRSYIQTSKNINNWIQMNQIMKPLQKKLNNIQPCQELCIYKQHSTETQQLKLDVHQSRNIQNWIHMNQHLMNINNTLTNLEHCPKGCLETKLIRKTTIKTWVSNIEQCIKMNTNECKWVQPSNMYETSPTLSKVMHFPNQWIRWRVFNILF